MPKALPLLHSRISISGHWLKRHPAAQHRANGALHLLRGTPANNRRGDEIPRVADKKATVAHASRKIFAECIAEDESCHEEQQSRKQQHIRWQ